MCRLAWTKPFSDPVMALTFDDVMGDGVLDLVVLTLKGLHILEVSHLNKSTYIPNLLFLQSKP